MKARRVVALLLAGVLCSFGLAGCAGQDSYKSYYKFSNSASSNAVGAKSSNSSLSSKDTRTESTPSEEKEEAEDFQLSILESNYYINEYNEVVFFGIIENPYDSMAPNMPHLIATAYRDDGAILMNHEFYIESNLMPHEKTAFVCEEPMSDTAIDRLVIEAYDDGTEYARTWWEPVSKADATPQPSQFSGEVTSDGTDNYGLWEIKGTVTSNCDSLTNSLTVCALARNEAGELVDAVRTFLFNVPANSTVDLGISGYAEAKDHASVELYFDPM